MLVLSRQRDETIMIGDDIELTVVDIRGDKVRLGIKASPHIPVHRKEVYEAIRRENKQAVQMADDQLANVRPPAAASQKRDGAPVVTNATRLSAPLDKARRESA